MMKKVFSLLIAVSVLSTSTASAVGITDGGTGVPVVDYITSISVSSETVNPAQNLSTNVSVSMVNTASLYVFVISPDYEVVGTLKANAITTPGTYNFVWLGTVGNVAGANSLANGEYTIRAFAYDTNGNVVDYDYKKITLNNESVVPVNVDVSNLVVTPSTITNDTPNSAINFDLNMTALLKVEILRDSTVIRTFPNYTGTEVTYNAGSYTIVWDGRNNAGNFVADGNYTARVVASNSVGSDTETKTIVVNKEVQSSSIIKNLTLYPSSSWDPNNDYDLEIDFDLTERVDNLRIIARKGSKTIEIYEEDYARITGYSEKWDGRDEDGEDIETGTWEIIVIADSDRLSKTINVVREVPEISEAFVTKTSFDNEIGEVSNLVFKLNTDAEVTVEIYRGSKRLERLLDEEEVDKNRWYSVEWDGTERGDEVSEGTYEFKITARNLNDRRLVSSKTVSVSVKEDTAVKNASNLTNDYTSPIVFDSKNDEYLSIRYCMDDDAEVYLAIYRGLSSSGTTQAVLLDYVSQKQGCHEVKWNGEDDKGKLLKDNIYSYKIITKSSDGKRDTETGRFVVGKLSGTSTGTDPVKPVDPTPVSCGNHYYDVTNVSPELCQAITWATNEGIFSGYSDGSFRPYQNINRAETLKVIFEAFRTKVTMLPANGSTLGFRDIDPNAWYMTYARTAKFYGMLHGYVNETEARFGNNINRVEFLKFALEASDAFTSYEVPGHTTTRFADVEEAFPVNVWYYDYAGVADTYNLFNTYFDAESGKVFLRPAQMVQRGEVALLLYRMYLNGLTQ